MAFQSNWSRSFLNFFFIVSKNLRFKLIIKSFFNTLFLLKDIKTHVLNLPTSISLSYRWNFGRFLGLLFSFQLLSGILLSINYRLDRGIVSYNSVIRIIHNYRFGSLIRSIHLNGSFLLFLILYLHFFRGVFYSSFRIVLPFSRGIILLVIFILEAFIGYVLPWGQISLWGATVITNLLSLVPYIGNSLVIWVWGGFNVRSSTISFFFSFHFFLPVFIIFIMILHIYFLHEGGSSSKLSLHTKESSTKFRPFFYFKDLLNIIVLLLFFIWISLYSWDLADHENFILANSIKSPLHIKPEWYFLFAYAVLRSVPNKVFGVVIFIIRVFIYLILSLVSVKKKSLRSLHKHISWWFLCCSVLLTWIGGKTLETPFIQVGQYLVFIYFFMILLLCF